MTMPFNNTFHVHERAPSSSLTRVACAFLMRCAQHLSWPRPKLKQAITLAYAWGVIDAATTQRLVDRYELWSD
jgi:hypothetical protein